MATNPRNRIFSLIFMGLLMMLAFPCGAASLPQYTVIDLGTLGGDTSIANGVNEQGAVAGKSETRDGVIKAFYWDSIGGMVEIGLGKALGLNDVGQVVGNIHHHGFSWHGNSP